MDKPTNHLDMESIESLNLALSGFDGTIIFVSHDREFVSSLATRIIELTPEKKATEEEIIKFCRETLAGFKIPKKIVFGELPKTSTGKIKKFELRKKAKEMS